jgi:hypothetical protein
MNLPRTLTLRSLMVVIALLAVLEQWIKIEHGARRAEPPRF